MKDTLEALCSHIAKLADQGFMKLLAAWAGGIFGYFMPTDGLKETFLIATLLILMDTITGLLASWTKGDAIESRRFSRLLAKLCVYSCVSGAVSLSVKTVPVIAEYRIPAVSSVLWIVIMTELISIIENADKMGLKWVPSWLRNIVRDAKSRAVNGTLDKE